MNAVRSRLEDLESCPLVLCPGLVEELRASGEGQSKEGAYKFTHRKVTGYTQLYRPVAKLNFQYECMTSSCYHSPSVSGVDSRSLAGSVLFLFREELVLDACRIVFTSTVTSWWGLSSS